MAEKVVYVEGKKRRCRVEVFALGPNHTILAASKGLNTLPFMPGGGIDEGETLIEAGDRELQEESGWLARNYLVIPILGDWVFNGPTDDWFQECGWEEEHSAAVLCDAIRFEPNEKYGSEGDSDDFTLLPMTQLVRETESALPFLIPRLRFMAMFRLAVLKQLLQNAGQSGYQIESAMVLAPSYTRW